MSDASTSGDTVQARPHHLVTSHWDAAGGEVLYRSCTCGEEWARDEDRCPEDDIETLDVADLLDRLDLIQTRNPDEQRHLDDTLDALRRELAEPSADTVQARDTDGPSDALVLTAAAGRLRAMSEHHRQEFSHILSGIAQWMEMVLYVEDNAYEKARALRSARALLGTDTTPAVAS